MRKGFLSKLGVTAKFDLSKSKKIINLKKKKIMVVWSLANHSLQFEHSKMQRRNFLLWNISHYQYVP